MKLSKQSESPVSVQKNEYDLKESAVRARSESESDQEELQNCIACKQTHPPIRRYPKTHWIQCDNSEEWWHFECACVSLEDSAKYGHYKKVFHVLCVYSKGPHGFNQITCFLMTQIQQKINKT